ncbi:hypothetical protein HXA31_09170 [Salipaludibacillus agaradhaerens]|uniref:Uncharacterized protein n=1 Tax=Salipaludibacillus agaradhaerens TaxID=76935 RepID=A0A9Q4FYM7_SALAG|nr:hypothetical protein [Salipaludibacillus agaradhaerens]MCR6095898.1 hypothetical protein [Salipaludibacillus agaradhaerens]MCR6114543.1 hypothetical protein [Salipaludibacillus agaradhaerens]
MFKKFDIYHFICAVLGTIGLIGIGISFAQLSLSMFLSFSVLTLGSIYAGFRRKKQLQSTTE